MIIIYTLIILNICYLGVLLFKIWAINTINKWRCPDIKFILHNENALTPKRATKFSAGLDLSILETVTLHYGESKILDTGVQLVLHSLDHFALVCDRSSIAFHNKLRVVCQVIDIDYRDTIKIALMSHSKEPQQLIKGQRVAQLLILPISYANGESIKLIKFLDSSTAKYVSIKVRWNQQTANDEWLIS